MFGSHRSVKVAVGLINLLRLALLAALAEARPQWGIMTTAIAWASLVLVALRFNAGLPEAKPVWTGQASQE